MVFGIHLLLYLSISCESREGLNQNPLGENQPTYACDNPVLVALSTSSRNVATLYESDQLKDNGRR